MIDIHSHILYDIEGDDGSRSLDMSLGMLRQAAASGVTDMFATPHMHRRGVVPSWACRKGSAAARRSGQSGHPRLYPYRRGSQLRC